MLGNSTSVRIVSEQSTSRPGCILELDAMVDAVHDWKQTQFLHVFQQQLLTGIKTPCQINTVPSDTADKVSDTFPTSQRKSKLNELKNKFLKENDIVTLVIDYSVPLSKMPLQSRMSLMELAQSAVVDLQESPAFSEPFFVVVIEKEQESESNLNESFSTLNSNTRNNTETAEGIFFFFEPN